MDDSKNIETEINQSILHDDGIEVDVWQAAERKEIMESLGLSYTERFRIMMRLMRIDKMLSRAKVTHKKMP